MDRVPAGRFVVFVVLSACGQTAEDPSDSGVSVGGGGAGVGGSVGGGGSRNIDAGSGGVAGAGYGGGTSCETANDCSFGEYCGCNGFCQQAPETCPGECSYVCQCAHFAAFCNPCIAKQKGVDTMGGGLSGCTSDGGGPGYDGGVGAGCLGTNNCNAALKCCYVCNEAGSCSGHCTTPEPNGECADVVAR